MIQSFTLCFQAILKERVFRNNHFVKKNQILYRISFINFRNHIMLKDNLRFGRSKNDLTIKFKEL